MNKMSIIKQTMDDIKNMVAWKHEYNRMVTNKLVVGPRLHIKMPVEKTKTEEPSKEDQIKEIIKTD